MTMKLTRRDFAKSSAAACALALTGSLDTMGAGAPKNDIIDAHTHFYDPKRPGGVTWPPREEARLYRTVLPKDLRLQAAKWGVTGTVVVEASELLSDNQWILDLAAKDRLVVGFVGNIALDDPDFEKHIRRFARNSIFRGVRARGQVTKKLGDADVQKSLETLSFFDLSLDYNAVTADLPMVAKTAQRYPGLRIIINHVANVFINGKAPPKPWMDGMKAVAQQPNVYLKLSGLVEGSGRIDASAPKDLGYYLPILDASWEIFGADRLIYGSNWPVSELFADYETVFRIVNQYFNEKGWVAMNKFFALNAKAAYKWIKR